MTELPREAVVVVPGRAIGVCRTSAHSLRPSLIWRLTSGYHGWHHSDGRLGVNDGGSRPLSDSIGVLRHPCDLALVLFFHRHPRALLPADRLAALVGHNLKQVTQSLDLLTDAGLLEPSQRPTPGTRLYVLNTPDDGWLADLLEIAATHEGRRNLIEALRGRATAEGSADFSPKAKTARSRVAPRRTESR